MIPSGLPRGIMRKRVRARIRITPEQLTICGTLAGKMKRVVVASNERTMPHFM
jgi:hypothetical protein